MVGRSVATRRDVLSYYLALAAPLHSYVQVRRESKLRMYQDERQRPAFRASVGRK